MAKTQFEIINYQVTLGADLPGIVDGVETKVVANIGCYGKKGKMMVNFIEVNHSFPKSSYDADKELGTMYLPIAQLPHYVDILRNEKPLFAYCNKNKPQWNSISTGHEPVGEGE